MTKLVLRGETRRLAHIDSPLCVRLMDSAMVDEMSTVSKMSLVHSSARTVCGRVLVTTRRFIGRVWRVAMDVEERRPAEEERKVSVGGVEKEGEGGEESK